MPMTRPSGTRSAIRRTSQPAPLPTSRTFSSRREIHLVKNRQDDGEMVFFHALAAAGFGPAVEFFAECFVVRLVLALEIELKN